MQAERVALNDDHTPPRRWQTHASHHRSVFYNVFTCYNVATCNGSTLQMLSRLWLYA